MDKSMHLMSVRDLTINMRTTLKCSPVFARLLSPPLRFNKGSYFHCNSWRALNRSKRSSQEQMATLNFPQGIVSASAGGAKRKALISVSDKSNLDILAKGLSDLGFEIVSTGGSASAIKKAGVKVTCVEDLTGFPEMLDGRVKTLHPKVHGGVLARRDKPEHLAAVEKHSIDLIDVVIVNLYPFRQCVLSPDVTYETGVENIDIGGPAMLRAAAKNHEFVVVAVDPADYNDVLNQLRSQSSSEESSQWRRMLAWKAFQHTATYDSYVAEWMWNQLGRDEPAPEMTIPMRLGQKLRYGENPHQSAAFYVDLSLAEASQSSGVATAIQHHGKEMSYNNYLDCDAAYLTACDFKEPACVIVKHTNPCGVAVREDLLEAYRLAVRADPISAFGGIVAFNRVVDEDLATEIREFRSPTDDQTRMFYEIVIAPGYTAKGLEILKGKSKTLRILEAKGRAPVGRSLRQVSGGWLAQNSDSLTPDNIEFTCVSDAKPTDEILHDCKFAWLCVKHVKSNAITVSKGLKLLGMGSGQPNRVKSVQIALEKAGDEVTGSVLASDAFFPFSWGDSVEIACKAGVAAIVHPGGSVRDQDAIDCCNKYGVVLLVTGVRHFKH